MVFDDLLLNISFNARLLIINFFVLNLHFKFIVECYIYSILGKKSSKVDNFFLFNILFTFLNPGLSLKLYYLKALAILSFVKRKNG